MTVSSFESSVRIENDFILEIYNLGVLSFFCSIAIFAAVIWIVQIMEHWSDFPVKSQYYGFWSKFCPCSFISATVSCVSLFRVRGMPCISLFSIIFLEGHNIVAVN